MIDLYSERGKYKIIILLIALLIGTASVYYTNFIIAHLASREEEQIRLYSKELQFLLKISEEKDSGEIDDFLREMLQSNTDVPLIWTDEDGNVIDGKNIPVPANATDEQKKKIFAEEFEKMKEEHTPIVVEDTKSGLGRQFIYFHNSYMLEQLRYFPYVQLTVISVFAFLTYMAFSYSKRAEQNRVWIGLAKETAHQLGTPLSSLMAWIEYFKSEQIFANEEIINELEKDVKRLETVTARFSNIGSIPTLKDENVLEVVETTLAYLQKRISTKVKIQLVNRTEFPPIVHINRSLFEWVIENIAKNAVDAMGGVGELTISVLAIKGSNIAIDITDTGKGIAKGNIKQVFEPGFTTKKRGWGLGLTLAKRIIENYHSGKIFIKNSEVGKGTTFRIQLDRINAAPYIIQSYSKEELSFENN